MKDTPVFALQIIERGEGVYFGLPCHRYALNCHFVYLAIPETSPLVMTKQNLYVLFIFNSKK